MKAFLACLLVTTAAVAQSITYQLPNLGGVESYAVTGFDATTSTYTGFVYAKAGPLSCGGRGSGNCYHAECVSAVWDSTGNLLSFAVEWVVQGRTVPAASSCLGQ